MRIGVFVEVTRFDRYRSGSHRDIEPAPLRFAQFFLQESRLVVEFSRGGYEHATAGQLVRQSPLQPVVEQRDDSRLTSRKGQSRPDHLCCESFGSGVEHGSLQTLLRLKVCKESALGQLQRLSELPDRQTAEPLNARDLQSLGQNALA